MWAQEETLFLPKYPRQYRREIKWIQWWIHGGSLVDPTIKSVDPTFSGATKRGKSGGSIETTFPLYNFKRGNREETSSFHLPSPRSPASLSLAGF